MKQSGKKKRHLLRLDSDPEIVMIGLVTPDADYKTSLLLNSILNLNFRSTLPVVRENESGEQLHFSTFKSTSELNDNTFVLVSNKKENSHLSKKLAGIDYLLVLKGDDILNIRDLIISNLRKCREISGLFILDDLSVAETILLQIA
jgi:hypothetical protein